MADVKTVVIVGASFSGLATARHLVNAKHDNLNIVLVDKRDYLDLNFVSPRLLVQPEDASKIVKPLNSLPWMKGCTFVQDVVTSIGKSSVTFQGRDALEFDICVICTGSSYINSYCKGTDTLNSDDRIAQYNDTAAEVKAAKSALIIGGGFTGMEMAAETKEAGVDAVTLVHGKDFITNTPEQGKIPLQRLKKIGVKVKLNTRAEQTEGKTYRIDGETQTFDVVFKCVGFNPVHSHLITGLGDVLTPTGAIDVNESFQVKGYSNIFALGDAVAVDDDHLAYQAMNHALVAGKGILKLLVNPDAKLPVWKRNNGFRMCVLTLGSKNSLMLVGAKKCFTYVPGSMVWFKAKATLSSLGTKL